MIEVKNNQCIALSDIQSISYETLLNNIRVHGFRCMNMAAYERNNKLAVYILLAASTDRMYLEHTELDLEEHYNSIGRIVPSWVNFERELAENFGVKYVDHPWLKPVRYPKDACHKLTMAEYPFFKEEGSGVHEVAVGPVHAGVIEPGHFRFMCRGEKIDHLEIQLGYQHRGVEKLMCSGAFNSKRVLAESICSDSAVINSMLYFSIVEKALNVNISDRALAIRTIGVELEKAALHLSTLSGIANDIGYVMGAAFAGATRTYVINSLQSICGNRFGRGLIAQGGVAFDIDENLKKSLTATLSMVYDRVKHLKNTMFESPGVRSRLELTGAVCRETAEQIGLTGVSGRASGTDNDGRRFTDNPFYEEWLKKEKITSPARGDVFSRAYRRVEETLASLKMVLEILALLPEGECRNTAEIKDFAADSLIISVGEGPRGEVVHMAITSKDAASPFVLYKVKDPSFINWFALALSVRNNQISDFPLCNKSFDLSYSGNDL